MSLGLVAIPPFTRPDRLSPDQAFFLGKFWIYCDQFIPETMTYPHRHPGEGRERRPAGVPLRSNELHVRQNREQPKTAINGFGTD